MDDARRCTATNRAGDRCGRAAILGGTVCRAHGGAAPAVRARAKLRLLEAADPAAAALVKLVDHPDPHVVIRATTAILRAAGVDRTQPIDLNTPSGIDAQQIVQVMLAVFSRLGMEVDEHVRHVVAQELRAMSPSSRPQLRPVQ